MDVRQSSPIRLGRLLGTLVVLIIVADQLSKAYFVYLLGFHGRLTFMAFLARYFTLWGGEHHVGAVRLHFAPFLPPHPVLPPWVYFTLTTNTGAAWSIFEGNSLLLSFVSLAMAALLYAVWLRSFRRHAAMTWALGAIIGGALGNFIDRFRLREVVDFVDVKIPLIGRLFPALGDPYDFPIFNVADSCAVIGTLALALYLVAVDLRGMRRRRKMQAAAFTPYREGLVLDDDALRGLRALAAAQPRPEVFGLTRHFSLPEGGGDGVPEDEPCCTVPAAPGEEGDGG
jgi:signal peptidase II